MIKNKTLYLGLLFLLIGQSGFAQTIKGYTKDEISDYSAKVEDQVRFLEYLLNTVGSAETPPRDKDVVIRESYLKIFRDGQVQVEDDLLLDRKVVTNKDVTAYLKDIEFFYEEVDFKFKVREVKPAQKDNGEVYFLASLDRTIEATGRDGEKINNTKPRFVEVNLDNKTQELKIVSIYTTKLSRDEELKEWWSVLDPNWQEYFMGRFGITLADSLTDSVTVDELYRFVSVDSLDISGSDSLLDLSPLEAMRDLKYVDLSNTQITELGPISNVTFLEYLDVSNTPTSDIQFIKYSDRLKHLDISKTQIQDIGELVNLKALRSLRAEETPIMSFAVLNEFDSLKNLYLSQSGFNNAENIKALKNLEQLDISRNYLINFSSLQELESLKVLNLSNTNIQDLSPIEPLENLEVVDLTATPIADIAALNNKPSLIKVLTDETKLSVQSADNFIRNNPKVLLIHHVKDLESWWAGLSEAWKASLKEANPDIVGERPSVETLTSTIGLEELDLSDAGIESLNPVTRFVKLKKIDFSDNPVSDLISLSEVKTLDVIIGKNTQISDIAPLNSNENLIELDLAGSPVESIFTAMDLPRLQYLNVDNSAIMADEVPHVLLQKPELIIVYRSDELNAWWEEIGEEWKQIFQRQYDLPADPDSKQLHQLTERSSLSFERVSVTQMKALQAFVNLRSLVIFDAPLQDISPISELKLLQNLKISQVPVNSFEPLAALKNLEQLDISNSGIEDMDPLAELYQLKVLNVSGTNLKTLSGLEGLMELIELDVASTNLRTLRHIEGLPNLRKLSCFNTRLNSRTVDRFKESNPDCEVRYY
ncbi:leucine-rich repeat domain-containing protein [Algoriphagus halophytocola]|uniref:Leucine-rich repeat domain-containing protein n=1 Tax=Algoriphagus halophytocola TaxID=2991499 RepID=A0ABY6ML07_9BACT|nr:MULTISPECIES: leucine-rich repeat domain-containing protein [unclassified Algoriphagus]UZD23062.1 leucine-rich repeat domain-containing protein [Algoriphagus sp. TR-M5]WBL44354.1 leucine-rich repeat domain-containing protein [Algoriphagus sp. TR-M9]